MQYPIQYGKPDCKYVSNCISYILERPDLSKSIYRFMTNQINNYDGIIDLRLVIDWVDDRSLAFQENAEPIKYFMNSFKYNLKKGQFDKTYIDDFPIHDFIKYLIEEKTYRWNLENYTELYILLDNIDCFLKEKHSYEPQSKLKDFLDKVISYIPPHNKKLLNLAIFIKYIQGSNFLKDIGFGQDKLEQARKEFEETLTKWSASEVSFFEPYFKGE